MNSISKILKQIPFSLDFEKLAKKAHLDLDCDEDVEIFSGMLKRASQAARPKALWRERESKVIDEETVMIENQSFKSRTLAKMLHENPRVFIYCATCGNECDFLVDESVDPLQKFWADEIRTELLFSAFKFLQDDIKRKTQIKKLAAMVPGSGETEQIWSITELKKLFETVNGEFTAELGVKLTPSCLMLPNKTVAGIFFASEHDFKTCRVCRRQNCPNRQAPFDEKIWNELHGV